MLSVQLRISKKLFDKFLVIINYKTLFKSSFEQNKFRITTFLWIFKQKKKTERNPSFQEKVKQIKCLRPKLKKFS